MKHNYFLKKLFVLTLGLSSSVLFGQQTYTFTNASAVGQNGPTQAQTNAAYSATSLNGTVTINTQGIQEWIVPQTTSYSIEVFGAKGGDAPGNNQTRIGGNGASMYGEFTLNAGDNISILVGQMGGNSVPNPPSSMGGGGGGGTFVVINGVISLAAGGGGGAGIGEIGDNGADGTPGLTGTTGNVSDVGAGTSGDEGAPGINGAGGTGGNWYAGSGGAGWNSNGGDATGGGLGTTGGLTFSNGGLGGNFSDYQGVDGGVGGFGGGGGAKIAGGGGYSGGAAGAHGGNYHAGSGGGGGSYNIGVNPNNVSDVNNGEGYVVITILCNASASAINAGACDAYTVPSGNATYMVSGVYNDTIPNATGCDSIMTITVNITSLDLNTTTTDLTISADHASGTYQWINCSDNLPIAGETNQTFTATENGDYAVIITDGPCSDTSACATIAGVGINETNGLLNGVSIYPNPSNGQFYISSITNTVSVTVYSVDGKVIINNLAVNDENQLINLGNVETGVYFVEVSNDTHKETIRLIVK